MSQTILIRRSPHHAVIAHIKNEPEGIRLLRLSPDSGPVPEIPEHPGFFPDIASLRQAVIAWMKQGGPWTTLDRVLLAPSVIAEWNAIAERIAIELKASGSDPAAIPDEQARELSGKWLLIHVPGIKGAELRVCPGQWAWAGRRDPWAGRRNQ